MSARRGGIHQKMKYQKQQTQERRITPNGRMYNQDRVIQIPRDQYERPVSRGYTNGGPRQYNDYYEEEQYYDPIEVPPRKRIDNRQLVIPGRERPPYVDQRSKQIIKQDDYYNYQQPAIVQKQRYVSNNSVAPLKTLRINKPKQPPVVSQTLKCQSKGILPVVNPTGNPFSRGIKVPKGQDVLKKLQVKVDLQKIGDAPRAISQRLIEAHNFRGHKAIAGRVTLSQRFQKIQNAQRAMHPLTIQLLNEKMGFKGAAAKNVTTESNIPPEQEKSSLRMPKQKKQEIVNRIQSRRNKIAVQKKYVRK